MSALKRLKMSLGNIEKNCEIWNMKKDGVKHLARTEIYGLYDPNTNELRYIGKANDSKKRLASHLRDARRRDYPVYRWINKLLSKNQLPIMKVLLVTDSESWREDEKRIIKENRESGVKLLNVAEGGDEPYCSRETRAANGKKNSSMFWSKLSMAKKKLATSFNCVLKHGGIERAEKLLMTLEKRDKKGVIMNMTNNFRLKIEHEKQIRRQT